MNALTLALTIVFGLATIVSIVIAIRLARKQKPTYACRTTHLIGRGSNAPQELKVTFKGEEVEDVYRTLLLFFNAGNDTLNYFEIADKLSFCFYDARVLKTSIVKASRDVIKFDVKNRTEWHHETDPDKFFDDVELEFKWLGHTDGAVVEVLHTKCDKIELEADFKNTKLRKIKWMNINLDFQKQVTWMIAPMIIITLGMWITRFCVTWLSDMSYLPYGVVTGLTIFIVISPTIGWIRYLSIPKWARKI